MLLLQLDPGSVVDGLAAHDGVSPASGGTLAGVLDGLLTVKHGLVSPHPPVEPLPLLYDCWYLCLHSLLQPKQASFGDWSCCAAAW